MEGMFTFVGIIIIVFGVLQIILFFKVWGMTNNVSEMKNMMELFIKKEDKNKDITYQEKDKKASQNIKFESDIKIDDLVVELKNERQLKVCEITPDRKYKCRVAGGSTVVGVFSRDEIELFNKYWSKSK